MNYAHNCLSYWYPRIEGKVPTPETQILTLADATNWHELGQLCEGVVPSAFHVVKFFYKEAIEWFGLPMFMRTGQGSGKHDWARCCHLTQVDEIGSHIANLVEWSQMVDMLGLPVNVWVAREMLDTTPLFRCIAYRGMPIVREWRVFVDGREAIKAMPYWPEEAIEQGRPDTPDWRSHMAHLREDAPFEAIKMAETVGSLLPEHKWSVDVLEANDGLYVTDMAIAENSWGWE